jgi:hypothetical protein
MATEGRGRIEDCSFVDGAGPEPRGRMVPVPPFDVLSLPGVPPEFREAFQQLGAEGS